MVGLWPDRSPEPQHDITTEQRGKKHDLRRQEQPHDELAAGEWQAGLILEVDMAMVAVVMAVTVTVIVVVAMRNG